MGQLTEAEWARLMEGWDAYHFVDVDTEEGHEQSEDLSDDAMELVPRIPTIDELPALVDYSIRGEGDFVVSGRLPGGRGNGAFFDSELRAYKAMAIKYGSERVSRWDAGVSERWAFLIKRTA